MIKRTPSRVLSVQGSRIAGFTADQPSGELSRSERPSGETAVDFWLALILVFAAAAFLDMAAVMF